MITAGNQTASQTTVEMHADFVEEEEKSASPNSAKRVHVVQRTSAETLDTADEKLSKREPEAVSEPEKVAARKPDDKHFEADNDIETRRRRSTVKQQLTRATENQTSSTTTSKPSSASHELVSGIDGNDGKVSGNEDKVSGNDDDCCSEDECCPCCSAIYNRFDDTYIKCDNSCCGGFLQQRTSAVGALLTGSLVLYTYITEIIQWKNWVEGGIPTWAYIAWLCSLTKILYALALIYRFWGTTLSKNKCCENFFYFTISFIGLIRILKLRVWFLNTYFPIRKLDTDKAKEDALKLEDMKELLEYEEINSGVDGELFSKIFGDDLDDKDRQKLDNMILDKTLDKTSKEILALKATYNVVKHYLTQEDHDELFNIIQLIDDAKLVQLADIHKDIAISKLEKIIVMIIPTKERIFKHLFEGYNLPEGKCTSIHGLQWILDIFELWFFLNITPILVGVYTYNLIVDRDVNSDNQYDEFNFWDIEVLVFVGVFLSFLYSCLSELLAAALEVFRVQRIAHILFAFPLILDLVSNVIFLSFFMRRIRQASNESRLDEAWENWIFLIVFIGYRLIKKGCEESKHSLQDEIEKQVPTGGYRDVDDEHEKMNTVTTMNRGISLAPQKDERRKKSKDMRRKTLSRMHSSVMLLPSRANQSDSDDQLYPAEHKAHGNLLLVPGQTLPSNSGEALVPVHITPSNSLERIPSSQLSPVNSDEKSRERSPELEDQETVHGSVDFEGGVRDLEDDGEVYSDEEDGKCHFEFMYWSEIIVLAHFFNLMTGFEHVLDALQQIAEIDVGVRSRRKLYGVGMTLESLAKTAYMIVMAFWLTFSPEKLFPHGAIDTVLTHLIWVYFPVAFVSWALYMILIYSGWLWVTKRGTFVCKRRCACCPQFCFKTPERFHMNTVDESLYDEIIIRKYFKESNKYKKFTEEQKQQMLEKSYHVPRKSLTVFARMQKGINQEGNSGIKTQYKRARKDYYYYPLQIEDTESKRFSFNSRLTDYKLPKGDKNDLNTWIHVVEHDEVDGCLYGRLEKQFEAVQNYNKESKRYVKAKYSAWVKLQRRLGEKMVRGTYAEPLTLLVQASDFTTVAPRYSEEESYEDSEPEEYYVKDSQLIDEREPETAAPPRPVKEDVGAQQSFDQVPIDMLQLSDSNLSSSTKENKL